MSSHAPRIVRMMFLELLAFSVCVTATVSQGQPEDHVLHRRYLPDNENCDPDAGTCLKGDWLDKTIADCRYERSLGTCSVSGSTGTVISWIVGPERNDRCQPANGKRFLCGAAGTNTRCVCSDYKIQPNRCRCQYWTENTPGESQPGYCITNYLGGESNVHHYACCNNCNDSAPATCDGTTYEGGSSGEYCGSCGQPTGGGRVKFTFNCASCEVQTQCRTECDQQTSTLPGFCWKWVDCFKGCCQATVAKLQRTGLKRGVEQAEFNISSVGFCGDGVCSESESQSLCPFDCCHRVNRYRQRKCFQVTRLD